MDVWASALCFNTVEAENKKLPAPTSWADLTNPVYQGPGRDAQPGLVGHGFPDGVRLAADDGRGAGWAYMDALHKNVAAYTHSGSKPCRQAGAGEYAVGLSFEYRANKTKKDGAPIAIVLPKEGLGWDMEATAIMATTKQPEAAKKLADWAVTPAANELYAAELRDRGAARHRGPTRVRRGRHPQAADQERLRLGRRKPRPDPGRVVQALRRQVRAEELSLEHRVEQT